MCSRRHDDVVEVERRHDVFLAPTLHGHHHVLEHGTSHAQAEAGEPRQVVHAQPLVHGVGRLAHTVAGKIKTCTKTFVPGISFVGW